MYYFPLCFVLPYLFPQAYLFLCSFLHLCMYFYLIIQMSKTVFQSLCWAAISQQHTKNREYREDSILGNGTHLTCSQRGCKSQKTKGSKVGWGFVCLFVLADKSLTDNKCCQSLNRKATLLMWYNKNDYILWKGISAATRLTVTSGEAEARMHFKRQHRTAFIYIEMLLSKAT